MNKSIKFGAFLFVLLAVLGALLVLVNTITAPIIEERRLEEIKKTIKEVVPTIDGITDETENVKNKPAGITNIYLSTDKKVVIYVAQTTGYKNGLITTIVAFDVNTKNLVNAKVTEAVDQTSGIGDQIRTYEFKYAGKAASVFANLVVQDVKNTEKDYIISGATVSSKAVLTGVHIASKNFLEVYGG